MPLPLTTAARNAIASGRIASAWFLELHTDGTSLRCWDQTFDVTYLGETYEGIGPKWRVSTPLKSSADLIAEPLSIEFDTTDQLDNASFVGRLLDSDWHQRRMRLFGLLFEPGTNFHTVIGEHIVWEGRMDTWESDETPGAPSVGVLSCESGVFRALGRNMTTCSHGDQARRDATDDFFKNTAHKPQQEVPFGLSWANVPGGGSRGGSGGGGGPGNNAGRPGGLRRY